MTKARIEFDDRAGVWLKILHTNSDENYAFALQEDEVEPVMKACQKWLKDKKLKASDLFY